MIIQNGTIEVKRKCGGGIDPVTGHPVKASASYGPPIPCQIVPNTINLQGRANGEHFTVASYQIYIEEQWFTGEQLRVTDLTGRVMGEFAVISIEPLKAVCETRILI